jgi:hypothetical protein
MKLEKLGIIIHIRFQKQKPQFVSFKINKNYGRDKKY